MWPNNGNTHNELTSVRRDNERMHYHTTPSLCSASHISCQRDTCCCMPSLRQMPLLLTDRQTDRLRTDVPPFHKPCSAYYADSVNRRTINSLVAFSTAARCIFGGVLFLLILLPVVILLHIAFLALTRLFLLLSSRAFYERHSYSRQIYNVGLPISSGLQLGLMNLSFNNIMLGLFS